MIERFITYALLVTVVAVSGPSFASAQADAEVAPDHTPDFRLDEKVSDGPDTGLRIAAEFGGAAAGAAVALIPAGIYWAIADAQPKSGCDLCGLGEGLTAIGIYGTTALFAIPAGVYLVGESMGGDGNYWYTFLGSVAGVGIELGAVAALSGTDNEVLDGLAVVGAFALPMAGAVLLYELTNRGPASRSETPRASSGFRAVPTAGVTSDGKGAFVGTHIRF